MQNAIILFILLVASLNTACTTELLHSELAIEVVPEIAEGAKPYYVDLPQPSPRFESLPDTFAKGQYSFGPYLATIVPYRGIALWTKDTSLRDTLPKLFIKIEGFLDYDFDRRNNTLLVSQFSAHYEIDLQDEPFVFKRLTKPPFDFDPYRFLSRTLGLSGYINEKDYYLNCPDPDSILAGFTFELLNNPSCKYR